MPYRRRVVKRRRPVIRRRRYRRRTGLKRSILPKVYGFKRTCELDNFVIAASAAGSTKTYNFYLSQLPSYTEFTTLFDQYRIMAVKVTFYPPFNVAFNTASNVAEPVGEFYSVVDYDGGNTSTVTLATMTQYQNLRRTYFNKPHTRYFKPRAYQYGVMDGASSFGGYTTMSHKSWFDVASPSIRYYGLYVGWDQSQVDLTRQTTIRVTATYYLQFKQVR